MHWDSGFPVKDVRVQFSGTRILTPATRNLQHETVIINLAHGSRGSRAGCQQANNGMLHSGRMPFSFAREKRTSMAIAPSAPISNEKSLTYKSIC